MFEQLFNRHLITQPGDEFEGETITKKSRKTRTPLPEMQRTEIERNTATRGDLQFSKSNK